MTVRDKAAARAAFDATPTEVELKFDVVDLAAARQLLNGNGFAGVVPTGPVAVINLIDRYVDTATGSLRRSGWVGRLRLQPDDAQATTVVLKSTARRSRGAMHTRSELEGPADVDHPPADWPASPARDRLLAVAGDAPLQTTIVLEQRRRQRVFGDEDFEVEVSLDRVRAVVGDQIVDRSLVLEAELRTGPASRLEDIGDELSRLPFLVPSSASKLARALSAAERFRIQSALPDPTAVKSPGVRSEDLVGEAGRKVLAFHFARLLAKESGTREGRDPEELHQMRVATRRMRAAWRVFGDAFEPRATRSIRTDLRDLATALGAVRDLDVLLLGLADETGPEQPEGAAGLRPFIEALRSERDDARRRLFRLLDRPGYHRWVSRSAAFLTTAGAGLAQTPSGTPRRVRDTAPSRIWLAYEHVRAFGDVLRWADVPTIHQLRIAGKRLRYALEFIQETLTPDVGPLLVRVTALQDHLGLLNDADVAAGRARAFLVERGTSVAPAEAEVIGRYVVDRERDVARLQRTIGRVWRGVDGPAFRRRLGRAVARL
jgi:CHAD domain-containing protein